MMTVKQFAALAGVSARTLRYYDQIDLLKPEQTGENGYRYYSESSVLRLQQILLYREMGLPLEEIGMILARADFDVIAALERHKDALLRRIERTGRLVETVEETIRYLKGNKMNKPSFFEGFSDAQQEEYAREAEQMYDPATVRASMKKWKSYSAADKEQIGREGEAVYADFVAAMPRGAASPAAQDAVARWRKHMDYFWTPNPEQLLGLAEGYNSDARFKANFDRIHPDLAEFIQAAVQEYVRRLPR